MIEHFLQVLAYRCEVDHATRSFRHEPDLPIAQLLIPGDGSTDPKDLLGGLIFAAAQYARQASLLDQWDSIAGQALNTVQGLG